MLLRVFDPGRLSASKGVGSDLAYGVTGDIRAIGGNDFKALGVLSLPPTVQGGTGHKCFNTYFLVSCYAGTTPPLATYFNANIQGLSFGKKGLCWSLSEDSPLIGMMVR